MKEAVETRQLSKFYKQKAAVEQLNLTIHQGELFALLGVNGAGKTTTIKLLSCLTAPTDGDAFLMGFSVRTQPMQVKGQIGVSPQETAVAPNLSVKENLELMAGLYGQDKAQCRTSAQKVIEQLSLTEVSKSRAKTLSGGWQRRLSIAMSLITNPHILFLDEPTLGLDILARRELWQVIHSLHGSVTIILTTHYLEEAEALADRIGIMVNGQLAATGSAQELKELAQTDSFEDAFISLTQGGKAS